MPPVEVAEIFSREAAVRGLLGLAGLTRPLTMREFAQECGCREKVAPEICDILVREGFIDAPKVPGHGTRGKFQIVITPRGRHMASLLRPANEYALGRSEPAC